MKIKEIKISIHRKYTKNYQSFGFRLGVMFDVEENETATEAYKYARQFVAARINDENAKIKKVMDKI